MKKFVAYYRVSTKEQGNSGLGLSAQKKSVDDFIDKRNGELLKEFTEVESGKNDERPILKNAIDYSKENEATLVIAKLDRLSRKVSFIFRLRDSQVDFVCCDIPEANTMTIGIFALLAQQERELISKRTKEALAEKKKQGFKLGSPQNLTEKAWTKSMKIRQQKAKDNENNKMAAAMINALKNNDMTLQEIADTLNSAGFKTSRGKKFFPMQVKRLKERLGN